MATVETIHTGSFIINMGVIPQTIGNGLKPYGLVYDLLKHYQVPVQWVINTSKTKDGIDFTHNGIDYRGGAFIIEAEYRTSDVNAAIASWVAQGVVGATAVYDFSVDVYKTLNYAPRWTLDLDNGQVAQAYFDNAGIPGEAYGGEDKADWKTPAELTACDDIFVLPHADPTWSTHNNLYYWNRDYKGNIWAACHAVSVLESLKDPSNSIQMNFLTTSGLVLYSDHKKDNTPPYSYTSDTDPVMQFMDEMDGATTNGSEQSYIPNLGGSWLPSTTVSVINDNCSSVPTLSAGPSAIIAYGRAYGDDNRGWVMYEAGHNHNDSKKGTEAEHVAAQRAFFNFSYQVAYNKFENPEAQINGLNDLLVPGQPININFSVPASVDLSRYQIQWTSSAGGSFSPNSQSQNVTFTPPAMYAGSIIVSLTLTDGCGNNYFNSEGVYASSLLAVSAPILRVSNVNKEDVRLAWRDLPNQPASYYVIQKSSDGREFRNIDLLMEAGNRPGTEAAYTDQHAFSTGAESYYRILSVFPGQKDVYSNIVHASAGEWKPYKESPIKLLRNPANQRIEFTFISNSAHQLQIQLFDPSGKLLTEEYQWVNAGESFISVEDPSVRVAAVHLLRVVTDAGAIFAVPVFVQP